MKVFRKKTFLILGTITTLWMLLIFFLSSQDGEQTAKLSLAISEFLSLFGGGGTEEAAAQTHMEIRKLAHIILFLVLGVISYLLVFYGMLPEAMRWKRGISMLTAFVIAAGYGDFDFLYAMILA